MVDIREMIVWPVCLFWNAQGVKISIFGLRQKCCKSLALEKGSNLNAKPNVLKSIPFLGLHLLIIRSKVSRSRFFSDQYTTMFSSQGVYILK
jgi:hypothetical protein